MLEEPFNLLPELRGRLRRKHDEIGRSLRVTAPHLRCFFDHDMRIGATHAEGAHGRQASTTLSHSPRHQLRIDVEGGVLDGNVWIAPSIVE